MSGRKIAVLRANGLGDFIFALPALQALRDTYPGDEIVYLGKPMHRELLDGRPSPVDRVIALPPYPGVGEGPDYQPDQAEVEDFLHSMQREKFDLALQIHGGGRYSNAFLRQLGASRTLGLRTPDAEALDVNVPYLIYFSEVLRYLEVVSHLDVAVRDLAPRLTVIERDRREAQRVLPDAGSRPVAVIHPGATDVRRRWPAHNFAAAARHLAQQDMTVYISGAGATEIAIARDIMDSLPAGLPIHNVSGRLSLNGLVGMLADADLMLSNDSGPLHVAEAVGTPSVGIYLACNMVNAHPMQAALSRPVIAWNTQCPLCGAGMAELEATEDQCPHDAAFTTDVRVADVLAAVNDLRRHSVPLARNAEQAVAALR